MGYSGLDNWLAVLVDDDVHSARMLVRTFADPDISALRWLGSADRAERLLKDKLKADRSHWPSLIIVDLKNKSTANKDFVASIASMARSRGTSVVVLSAGIDTTTQNALINAGASAVFKRHDELAAYREEISALVKFWVQDQHLDAVGT